MRILIIKTSSMGDVIHTLPALTDAGKVFPAVRFDWVVEENFAEIPRWHPLVDRVIPVALRRWRKNLFKKDTWREWQACRETLRATQYDFTIDAQGLLKSAWLVWQAQGVRCGLDWQSAREPLASLFYQRKIHVGKMRTEHAVTRVRKLFSEVLGYPLANDVPDYGIDRQQFNIIEYQPYVVFLHGTTWATKHWPEAYWIELAKQINERGVMIKLPWGNDVERERAERIAASCSQAEVLPRMKLAEVANVIAGAKAIVAVDTGLCHLAAALDVPTISLYGPTNPALTGALGKSQFHLAANFSCAPCFSSECTYPENSPLKPPCFATVPPSLVWSALAKLL